MQRTACFILALSAFALLTGCEDKNKGVETAAGQSASVAYEEPSYNYYAPDSSTVVSRPDPYDYSATDSSAGAAVPAGSTHMVAKGDTLYALARMYYSDQAKWKTIYEANRQTLGDPNMLRVGQELIIP